MKKVCTVCGIEKPLDEFNLHRRMTDGRYNQCKECKNASQRAWREKIQKGDAKISELLSGWERA